MESTELHETTVMVRGLNCSGCVGTLKRKALGIYGVVHVDVDLDPGNASTVVLRHAPAVDSAQVRAALADCGYVIAVPA